MGASICVSCGESMFAPPGGGRASRRPDSTPTPWKDADDGDSGVHEHRLMGADSDSPSSLEPESRPSTSPSAIPSTSIGADGPRLALADDRPGSGFHVADVADDGDSITFESLGPSADAVSDPGVANGLDTDSDSVTDLGADMPAPVALPKRERRSLCDICFGPAPNPTSGMCHECEDRAGVSLGDRPGGGRIRPRPVKRKTGALRRGVGAAVVGALLVAGGLAVLEYGGGRKAGAALLKGAVAEAVVVRLAVPDVGATHYRTELDVHLHRENRGSQFATDLSTVFDLRQLSGYLASVTLVEALPDAAVLLVRSESRLESQEGEYVTRDGGRQNVFPWDGHVEVSRLRATARGGVALTNGGDPTPARDVPPFVVFATTGAPAGSLEPGATWRAQVSLPCVVRLGGALAVHPFDCTFELVGRRVLDARDCVVVRVEAIPSQALGQGFDDLEHAGGAVTGALAFDIDTGLLVRADLDVDTSVWRGEGGNPDDVVHLKGSLTISRAGP